MYFDKPDELDSNGDAITAVETGWDFKLLLSANGLAVIALGILPGALMSLCIMAIKVSL
jgi:NADH-quinone oxidoreductase subunit N